MLDLITGLDLAKLPRLVGKVDLVAWLGLISLVDLVSRNQALAFDLVLPFSKLDLVKNKLIVELLSFVTIFLCNSQADQGWVFKDFLQCERPI